LKIFSKAEAKMATARIKLLRNKRDGQIRQMRRDIAMLLESGQDDIARIRVIFYFNPVFC
jgi:Regulator of Vps4 activity in the MVB pathway